MTPQEFVRKWAANERTERAASQTHFNELCELIGESKPLDVDPTGEVFTFEKGGATAAGGHGWADVWKKGAFAWEYKGPGKDLNAAYLQLKKYADMLENPPLLITSDTKRIEIHTNFTSTVKAVHVIELTDLADSAKRELLKNAFSNPERLRPGVTRQMVTKDAAEAFSQLAHHLQAKGFDPPRVAHFLNRLIFCMFAEDVGLLPNQIFTKLATASVAHPETFEANARQLFGGMAKGGAVAFEVIDWFNGGLFDDDSTLPLDQTELKIVLKCAALDWSNIEPSIFGTLFERGLDPDKRSQQGTHYTDPDTIMKIVRPVVLEPWQREWELERAEIAKLIEKAKKTVSEAAKQRYFAFLERLVNFRVLDPACGSGNFLYLSLRALKDFEKRVIHDAELLGLPVQFPRVGPEAVLGIEVNPYAAELARVTIWIGELQWMLENGFAAAKNPILKPLDQIECRDAILNEDGSAPVWPKADAIVGNPPFLGDKKMLRELGSSYVHSLRHLFEGKLPRGVDLCCYWLEKARETVVAGMAARVGLVATNSIRSGANRRVLDRISQQTPIFDAWSDEDWVNEGAAVRVSLICFSSPGLSKQFVLDGEQVDGIPADLFRASTASHARRLPENSGVSFQGAVIVGPFDIDGDLARQWLVAPANPDGHRNSDVLRPIRNGRDLMSRPRDAWVVNFSKRSEKEAALYELPFEYVKRVVAPIRMANRRAARARYWWRHGETGDGWAAALGGRRRYLAGC